MSSLAAFRHRLVGRVLNASMHGAAAVASYAPELDFRAHGIRVERDLRYAAHAACHLDLYVPAGVGPFPVVLYLHGGGFKLGSKRSHAPIAMPFARAGYLVVMVDYRLAPRHPFPAALEDVCEAFLWTLANVERYGGDPSRLVIAGESAGGNLTAALALASVRRFLLPAARRVFDAGVVPRAILPLCGYLQVSDPQRFFRARARPGALVRDRMLSVSEGYLRRADATHGLELADPLLWLEGDAPLERPHPPAFVSCGSADPILDDSLRLAEAYRRRGIENVLRIDAEQLHAFQAAVLFAPARRHWEHALAFLSARTG